MQPTTDTTQKKAYLPSPMEFPETDVVIYDGQCRFCRRQVERMSAIDRRGRLSFISLHDDQVAKRYPDLSHDELMQFMVLIDRRHNRHKGAAAFRYLSRNLPALWPLAPLMHIPFSLPFWQFVYRQFAKLRYRLGGREHCEGDQCSIHFK